MNSTMTKNAPEWEAFDEKEPDQFAWFVKEKKELSCMPGIEHQHKEETETIERLESTIKEKGKVAMKASILQKLEIRSEETTKA